MNKILFSAAFVLSAIIASAQTTVGERAQRNAEFKERPFKDRLAYGGDLSLQFGTYTYINLSPIIGYRLNPDFMMGFGLSYQYLAYRGPGYINRSHIYGGRIFARHEIGGSFFAHGEYEILNLEAYSLATGLGRRNVNMAGLGLGYKSMFGDFSYYYIMILYDFIQDPHTPYPLVQNFLYYGQGVPIIIKAGFIFGK